MNSSIIKLLEINNIKPTPMRMLVLEQMMIQQKNLSLSEIEELLYPSDRTTIYRTMLTFIKHGLIHSIETANSGSIYALCSDDCKGYTHFDHHPHFFCEQCKKVICSDDFVINLEYKTGSSNYKIDKVEVTMKGLCPDCNSN